MSIAEWESGFQSLGPLRRQKLWIPLTRLDHPERLWELRRLDSNPHPISELEAAQSEIAVGELFELAGAFLRFWTAAIWAQAKALLAKKLYRVAQPERLRHNTGRLGFGAAGSWLGWVPQS